VGQASVDGSRAIRRQGDRQTRHAAHRHRVAVRARLVNTCALCTYDSVVFVCVCRHARHCRRVRAIRGGVLPRVRDGVWQAGRVGLPAIVSGVYNCGVNIKVTYSHRHLVSQHSSPPLTLRSTRRRQSFASMPCTAQQSTAVALRRTLTCTRCARTRFGALFSSRRLAGRGDVGPHGAAQGGVLGAYRDGQLSAQRVQGGVRVGRTGDVSQ
jgi:hypothetical protein